MKFLLFMQSDTSHIQIGEHNTNIFTCILNWSCCSCVYVKVLQYTIPKRFEFSCSEEPQVYCTHPQSFTEDRIVHSFNNFPWYIIPGSFPFAARLGWQWPRAFNLLNGGGALAARHVGISWRNDAMPDETSHGDKINRTWGSMWLIPLIHNDPGLFHYITPSASLQPL